VSIEVEQQSNLQIFTIRTVCSDDLRVLAKLRRDQLNGCRVIASSRFLKYANFHSPHGFRSQSACYCKISSRSVEWLRSYCKISISNMAAVRLLGCVKYANFHFPHGLGSRSACPCKISSRSIEWLRSYCKFSISNMAAVRHLSLLKYETFHLQHGLGSRSACSCKIST